MRELVLSVLQQVRPRLALHHGDVELVDINEEEGVVRVRFLGTCKGCPLADMTLKMGIEALLLDAIPNLKRVEAVES